MALTAARFLEFEGQPEFIEPKCAGNDTFYRGAILVFDANGYANVPSDAANLSVAGVYTGKAEGGISDDAYAVASGSYPRLKLARGKTWVPVTGCAQSDVDEIWYVSDDGTMTQTAGSKTVGYRALDFKTGYLLFDFRVPDRIA